MFWTEEEKIKKQKQKKFYSINKFSNYPFDQWTRKTVIELVKRTYRVILA